MDALEDVKPENYQTYATGEQKGNFTFHDNEGQTMAATRRLRPVTTFLAGEPFEASADS